MLDNTTKKNIDDCRDVLVGKVPDPKSQIEQITLALIYKFMDDMDREAVEKFKGKAKFFTGTYSKYGWRKLFDPSLSGKDMLDLYSDALDKLQTNPNVPELFRNIFKNAYLPYRDPSTLKLFLKHINQFEYSHSEKLGDAFEYLLSVMGSQGDAGQFRTPRHIIDFVTACVNPQKGETVLDPACGTAGFLLSAYKHILNQNTDKRQGDKLKPDDRKKLATNFIGYDISPDMVRLSLANMYLHGFTTPQIHEYDTLSSEDRWQETFDVILANPPFMTPKGGIRPHKKFGVQATKAEVLFTDYIAEHLNINGRAGIIVPNGIVATSQTAYKELRKHLVNDSLIAVISLPAGVFQPYSGVKTSILILDKQLSKKSKHILFLKIENDGFELGAQRREHDRNDLPIALKTFVAFKESLSTGKKLKNLPGLATLVQKKIILDNKEIILSAERYIETEISQTQFDFIKLADIVEINGKAIDPVKAFGKEIFTYIDIESVENGTGIVSLQKLIDPKNAPSRARRIIKNGDVIVSTVRPNLKAFAYLQNLPKNCLASTGFAVLSENEKINGKYLYYIVSQDRIVDQMVLMSDKGQYPSITARDLAEIEIPLPPLEIQQQIVSEIEGYQKIIDGAKQVVNNYKPVISVDPEWKVIELGKLAKNLDGRRKPVTKGDRTEGKYPYYGASGIVDYVEDFIFNDTLLLISEDGANLISRVYPIAFTAAGKYWVNNHAHVLKFESSFLHKYVETYINQIDINRFVTGSAQPKLNQAHLNEIPIPIPPIEKLEGIVNSITEEIELVESNKKLIQLFEEKVKRKIVEVWGVKEVSPIAEGEKLPLVAEEKSKYKTKQNRNASIA